MQKLLTLLVLGVISSGIAITSFAHSHSHANLVICKWTSGDHKYYYTKKTCKDLIGVGRPITAADKAAIAQQQNCKNGRTLLGKVVNSKECFELKGELGIPVPADCHDKLLKCEGNVDENLTTFCAQFHKECQM
jgi:hypothetical protein